MQVCPACGEENPPRFRLCGYCGTPLAPPAPAHEVRKVVTILFCDLKGSTDLGERLDSESLREVMGRYFDAMRAEIERHGGTIEKFIGDAVMAVFGIPRLHEDDALRAVRAAAGMRSALVALNAELERTHGVRLANRTGVNTGEVVAGDASAGQRLVTGDAVNVAARLEQAAGEGEVLLGELTHRLVRERVRVKAVEALELKGKSERVAAVRLLEVLDGGTAAGAARRPVVGRDADLRALEEAYRSAADGRCCRLVVVTGDAGLGKSSLLDELLDRLGERALTLRGACLSYGDGVTFWPLVRALREAAGIGDEDDRAGAAAKLAAFAHAAAGDVVERIASAVGLADRQYPLLEIFWAVRRLLEALAADRPVVLVLEDLHWAEPTLLDLVDAVTGAIEDAPVLVVAVGRPELLEARPGWQAAEQVALRPLAPADAGLVVDHALPGGAVDDDARRRIVEAADGNPLFAEQLASMLVEAGLLRREEGLWLLDELPAGRVPPTIHALLSARLDRLESAERAVVDAASVIGFHFARAALEELVEDFARAGLDGHLEGLVRRRLVRRVDADTYRFDHVLVRESVYDALLKRVRASLHERFVRWADRVNGDRAVEFEEILGYHLEQAYRHLVELAPADEHALAVGRDGAHRLAAAGRRALERGDMPAASSLLLRATALLPPLDLGRLRLFPDLGEALLQIGEVARAESLLDDAIATAELADARAPAAVAALVRTLLRRLSAADESWNERAMEAARAAIVACAEAGDDAGLSRAWRLVGSVEASACRLAEAADALDRALEHARAAGDVRQERRGSTAYGIVLAYGPTPVGEALARCEAMAERVHGDRQSEAGLLCVSGHLLALRGAFAEARERMRTSRALFEELGLRVDAAMMCMQESHVEALAGDAVATEAVLRRGYAVLDELGDRFWLPSVAALLAQALIAQGRLDEADEMALVAEERARADDVDAQSQWRCARAKLVAQSGEPSRAEELAREAVALLERTDAVLVQIGALADLSAVLAAAGRGEAPEPLERALRLAHAKESPVLVARLEAVRSALPDEPLASRTR